MRWKRVLIISMAVLTLACSPSGAVDTVDSAPKPSGQTGAYKGSVSCRECHEKFYQLWASSHHGLAMQPYTAEFARRELTSQKKNIVIGKYRYRADVNAGQGWVQERGPEGQKRYTMEQVMGGKYVYYFLTLLERGRLQTLPVAYDVRRKEWFDTAASGVRHFPDRTDQPFNWKDWPYTFNSGCYGCHVSQLSTNYDQKTDTYHTVWTEPGINCETCHGPAEEHIKVCREAPQGQVPSDLKIISSKKFTPAQHNDTCAPCHAKMYPLTASFTPGSRYFDHYGLVGLEHPDFYPDGRDLGENYTFTSWRMSPCAQSGQISCLHCHTSSGRYRFKDVKKANDACLPCHKDRVERATEHTHHKADSTGNRCISCHMPMTEFARMRRSDHSMRPPMPAATIAFKSPNACTLCHADKKVSWSDTYVRTWHKQDYQAATLNTGRLIQAARRGDWLHLSEIFAYLQDRKRDEVIAASFIRLLHTCTDEKKWPKLISALQNDPSPMVRASAAEALVNYLTPESAAALLAATTDEYRLVRIRAAGSLLLSAPGALKDEDRGHRAQATAELKASLTSRPDNFSSFYNLGNFYMDCREYEHAIESYQTSLRLNPDNLLSLVNISLAYNQAGQNSKAEESLRSALTIEPGNLAAQLNLGMLLAEEGKIKEAETAFRAVLKNDPKNAVACFNLGIILSRDRMSEALTMCKKAYQLAPHQPKYAYTYAYYLYQSGDTGTALHMLKKMVDEQVPYPDAYFMLGSIYEKQVQRDAARAVYKQALENKHLSANDRYQFVLKLQQESQ